MQLPSKGGFKDMLKAEDKLAPSPIRPKKVELVKK